jgi:hypothetical protein
VLSWSISLPASIHSSHLHSARFPLEIPLPPFLLLSPHSCLSTF